MMAAAMEIQAIARAERVDAGPLGESSEAAVLYFDIEASEPRDGSGVTETDVFRAYASWFWYVNVEFYMRLIRA